MMPRDVRSRWVLRASRVLSVRLALSADRLLGWAGLLARAQHKGVEHLREIMQPVEVRAGQRVQDLVATVGERDPHHPPVVWVGRPQH